MQLLVINRVCRERGNLESWIEFIHVETQWAVAVTTDEQAGSFPPNVDLRLRDTNDRLPRQHSDERTRHKRLMTDRHCAQVQPDSLAELARPRSSGQDNRFGGNGSLARSDPRYAPILDS